MPDEIRFTASYGGWNFEKRLPITETTSDSEVVRALSEIRNGISAKAFELTGIDIPGIKSLAKSESEGKAGAQALASLNAGKVRAKLRELCNEKRSSRSQKLSSTTSCSGFSESRQLRSSVPMEDGIIFAAKKGDWISIKKLAIDEKTAVPEVIGILMGIRQSIDRKLFSFAGVDTFAIDELAARLAKGKKKGYSSAAELLSAPKPQQELLAACKSPDSLPHAEAYLNKALLQALGVYTEIETGDYNSAYPGFKVSKPRGNFGKRKKQ